MLGLGRRQRGPQQKADEIQHEFVAISDELEVVGRKLLEVPNEEIDHRSRRAGVPAPSRRSSPTRSTSGASGPRRHLQRGEAGLRKYMAELKELGDQVVNFAADQAIESLDAPEEAARMQADQDPRR